MSFGVPVGMGRWLEESIDPAAVDYRAAVETLTDAQRRVRVTRSAARLAWKKLGSPGSGPTAGGIARMEARR